MILCNLAVGSPAFQNEGRIPTRYTGYGEDISPEFVLYHISSEAESLVIMMDDEDHPIPFYNHWIIWNIPIMSRIPENIAYGEVVDSLGGAVQGRAYGKNRYRGPKPPFNSSHKYKFRIFTMSCKLDISPKTRQNGLIKAMQGKVLQMGSITGYYR